MRRGNSNDKRHIGGIQGRPVLILSNTQAAIAAVKKAGQTRKANTKDL